MVLLLLCTAAGRPVSKVGQAVHSKRTPSSEKIFGQTVGSHHFPDAPEPLPPKVVGGVVWSSGPAISASPEGGGTAGLP